MLFKQRFHDGIRSGSITLTFRRWIRAQVRVGGTYRLDADGAMEATSVQPVRVHEISAAEARRAGYADRATMIAELGRRDELTDADEVYRIEFRYVAQADPRLALREDDALSETEVVAIIARLERMDAAATHGPWTRAVLRLIEAQPRVVSTRLAAKLGRERFEFKADVRKLKALGLTISHDVGYELSARGKAVLREINGWPK